MYLYVLTKYLSRDCRLFAWALNAPGTVLPPQVGFRIGGKRSKVKYVVVQVHYAHKLAAGERDYSGMDLEVTSEPQKYLAGIFLLLSTPTIPPGEPSTVPTPTLTRSFVHSFIQMSHV